MKGIQPKQQFSKKALALLIVLTVCLLIINVQNIGALFIPPKTLNLNTVTSMTLFSNQLTIDRDRTYFIFFVILLLWRLVKRQYKTGMRITKVFLFLLMLGFIIFFVTGTISDGTFIDSISNFLVLVTMFLIACDFCFFIPKAKHNWVKAFYCICICFIMLIINTCFSHLYENYVWDNRNQAVNVYINDIKKVFRGNVTATDTNNANIWVSCFNCKLKEKENKGRSVANIQEGYKIICGGTMAIDYLPNANFSGLIRSFKFTIPKGDEVLSSYAEDKCSDNDLDENSFENYLLCNQTFIDIYMNKSGKITCEAFDGELKKEKKDGKIVFDYYPDNADENGTPLEIESNN